MKKGSWKITPWNSTKHGLSKMYVQHEKKCMMQKKGVYMRKNCIFVPISKWVPVKISLGVMQLRVHTAKWWIWLLTNYSSKKNWRHGTSIQNLVFLLPENKHYDVYSKMLLLEIIWLYQKDFSKKGGGTCQTFNFLKVQGQGCSHIL